jgi:hypothetical protein
LTFIKKKYKIAFANSQDKSDFMIKKLFFATLLLLPALSFGAMFPNDAITIPFSNPAIGEITLLASTTDGHYRTILAVQILNYKDAQTEGSYIDCDAVRIAKAYYKAWFDSRTMSYKCSGAIKAGNSGSLGSYGQVVYVDYDLSQVATTTTENINGFTQGEILISFFLFLLILGSCFSFIISRFLDSRPAK